MIQRATATASRLVIAAVLAGVLLAATAVLVGLLAGTAIVNAQTQVEDDLALLDSALEQPIRDVGLSVRMFLGAPDNPYDTNLDQPKVRQRAADAAAEAIAVMDSIGNAACYADWFRVTRTGFWLVGRSVQLMDDIDAAVEEKDYARRDVLQEEFGHAAAGFDLVTYSKTLRDQVDCSPEITVAPPTPKPTMVNTEPSVTPERTATPLRTDAPSPEAS